MQNPCNTLSLWGNKAFRHWAGFKLGTFEFVHKTFYEATNLLQSHSLKVENSSGRFPCFTRHQGKINKCKNLNGRTALFLCCPGYGSLDIIRELSMYWKLVHFVKPLKMSNEPLENNWAWSDQQKLSDLRNFQKKSENF
jgi:hypothetical protein